MTTVFPTDKTKPFVAENGITYVYEDDRWRVKAYKVEEDSRLPYRIETDKVLRDSKIQLFSGEAEIQLVDNEDNYSNVKFTGTNGVDVSSTASSIVIDGAQLTGDINLELDNYATKTYSDAEDQKLQNQIDDLSVSRGKVARYKVENTNDTPVARSGELATNTSFQPNVTRVSFGIEDLDGVLTKPMSDGDIIDFIDSTTEKLSRYRISDASGAPTIVAVTYVSGDADFAKDEIKQVYIYPQNQAGVTKEYVDAQDALKVDKAGDTMTGALVINNGSGFDTALEIKAYDSTAPGQRRTTLIAGADGKITSNHLIKSTRDQGYAFEVKPDDATTVSYLHTNGTFAFGGKGTITGNLDITTATSEGVRVLGSFKVKAKNQTIGGSNLLEVFEDKANYTGLITSDNNLVNKKYVDDNAGGGVVVHNSSTPPSSEPRGTMLLTTANALYIYL